jgi:hypothetical protein
MRCLYDEYDYAFTLILIEAKIVSDEQSYTQVMAQRYALVVEWRYHDGLEEVIGNSSLTAERPNGASSEIELRAGAWSLTHISRGVRAIRC